MNNNSLKQRKGEVKVKLLIILQYVTMKNLPVPTQKKKFSGLPIVITLCLAWEYAII